MFILLLMCSNGSNFIGKKPAKYDGTTLLKSSNKTCFQNIFKFYVLTYFCKWFTGAVEITAKFIQVYEVEKHEKKKGHWSENHVDDDISFNKEKKLFRCQTAGCATTGKCKYNIVKHLKSCYSVNKNQRKVVDNKICRACGKEFKQIMANRDRHSHLNSFMLKIIMTFCRR